jgi:hypothetical protein
MKKIKTIQLLILLIILAGIALLVLGIYQLTYPVVEVTWSTATEVNTFGFNLFRSGNLDGPFDLLVNPEVILATGQPVSGSEYRFQDRDVKSGIVYYYLLEEVQMDGNVDHFGPIVVKAKRNGLLEIILSVMVLVSVYVFRKREKDFIK